MVAFSHRPRLRSRFAFRDPALLFAWATLDGDHVTLTGWTWRGRYCRRIPLDRILHADVKVDDELALWLFDGEVLRLRIDDAPTWKRAIDAAREAAHPARTSSDPSASDLPS